MPDGYVPVPFPSWAYGADGSAILVPTAAAAAALPTAYMGTPTFQDPPPTTIVVPPSTGSGSSTTVKNSKKGKKEQ